MICDAVPGATVLGFQRPCIAIPSSVVEALTIDELDQVILHEHAHVQRRDDWSRLAQTLLLSVLWIHPAALVISRALSRECEMACDEWVVAWYGTAEGVRQMPRPCGRSAGAHQGTSGAGSHTRRATPRARSTCRSVADPERSRAKKSVAGRWRLRQRW